MSTVGLSCNLLLPSTHQISIQRQGKTRINVELGAALSRARRIDAFRCGVAWPWRGMWVFVMDVSWYSRAPHRWVWDWSRCSSFSYDRVQLRFLRGFDTAKPLTDLQASNPDIRVEAYLKSWGDRECVGVDGVPFQLHALEDPVARSCAVQAYLNEQARLLVHEH